MSLVSRIKSTIGSSLNSLYKPTITSTSSLPIAKIQRPFTANEWKGTQITYNSKKPLTIIPFLKNQYDLTSLTIKNLIKKRQLFCNEKLLSSVNQQIKQGDVISIPKILLCKRVDFEEPEILYQDKELLFINKPASMAVHKGHQTEEQDTIQPWIDKVFKDVIKPIPLHRLDKEASGVMMLAMGSDAVTKWAKVLREAQINEGFVEKKYWTMCIGVPKERRNNITSLIYAGKHKPMTSYALDRAMIEDEGKVALSRYHHATTYIRKTVKPKHRAKLSLLEWTLATGRKHQIRVHSSEQLKCPILGDAKYAKMENWNLAHRLSGSSLSELSIKNMVTRLHLHCKKIIIKDYLGKGQDLVVEASIPKHFVETIENIPAFWRDVPKLPLKLLKNRRY